MQHDTNPNANGGGFADDYASAQDVEMRSSSGIGYAPIVTSGQAATEPVAAQRRLRGGKKDLSYPKHWPHPSEEDLLEVPNRVVHIGTEQECLFVNNFVKTSKYEWYNFVPKFLLEEFNPRSKLANCYFLVVAALQCIPAVSNTGGLPTTLIPLLFVILINAILTIVEDMSRHRADKEANASVVHVYEEATQKFIGIEWWKVNVGNFVLIKNRETIPADVVILYVSEKDVSQPRGISYVETKSLDGETNLKIRNALPLTYATIQGSGADTNISNLLGSITMEHPNKLIDSFSGIIEIPKLGREPIQDTNVLLRGCVLRNTDWAVGIVVNTGADTKVMMGNTGTLAKYSLLEMTASKEITRVVFVLLVLCFIGSTGQAVWDTVHSMHTHWYLSVDADEYKTWFIKFAYYFLLHAQFVPVSLYVSMSLVRVFQSYFMNNDLDMYYEPIDCPASVRTMTLNEELGQISHIFTDKTGTLTCNVMSFRKASIHGVSYGEGITEIGKASYRLQGKVVPAEILESEEKARAQAVPHVTFYCSRLEADMQKTSKQRRHIQQFFKYVALCHDAIPEDDDFADGTDGERSESALSADSAFSSFDSSRPVSLQLDSVSSDSHSPRSVSSDSTESFRNSFRSSPSGSGSRTSLRGSPLGTSPTSRMRRMSASNPDDAALVHAADYFGFRFDDRVGRRNSILNHETGEHVDVEVLETIEFSSRRKRMTVVVSDPEDGIIRVVSKGADSIMYDRLAKDQDKMKAVTDRHVCTFSNEGLRCLVLCCREITKAYYDDWSARYNKARTDMTEIANKKSGLPNEIERLEEELECDLVLLGATAIEDKLQDGVPECISLLSRAGIKVWMLTGDKEETAMNIAVACNLLAPPAYMHHTIINKSAGTTAKEIAALLSSKSVERDMDSNDDRSASSAGGATKPHALIIDGPSLALVMADGDAKAQLVRYTDKCQAVVACRLSPDQKREMVRMVKVGSPGVRTLSIGDGANDVPMIQEAHVGVGLKGEEGLQAVNAADYSIAQFRYLATLLLKHGRYNYSRLADVVSFIFYKNILVSAGQFWLNFNGAFSGQKYYTEGAIQFFNLMFTSIPILLYGMYDQDVSYESVLRYPRLYQDTVRGIKFSTSNFWSWVLMAFYESVLCSVLPLYFMSTYDSKQGQLSSFWEAGATCYTIVIIMCNVKLCTFQSKFYGPNFATMIVSVGMWLIISYLISISKSVDFNYYGLWTRLLGMKTFWLTLVVIVTFIVVVDITVVELTKSLRPTNSQIVQEMEKKQKIESTTAMSSQKVLITERKRASTPSIVVDSDDFDYEYEMTGIKRSERQAAANS